MTRIAAITPTGFWYDLPSKSTINIEYYYHALNNLGFDSVIICPSGSRCSPDVKWISAPIEHYADPDFWKTQKIDIAIFFCWLVYQKEIQAMQQAGIRVIARADSSVDSSFRVFPKITWQCVVMQQKEPLFRLKMIKHFYSCYFTHYKKQDQAIINTCMQTDTIAIETRTGLNNLKSLFQYHKYPFPSSKIHICPHIIANDILHSEIPKQKEKKIVAIGRWDSFQKDSLLLNKSLQIFLKSNEDYSITIIGKSATTEFKNLLRTSTNIKLLETIPRVEIKQHLYDAQVLILSSRWESFHIAAHEALCMGATIVGPRVIPVPDILAEGNFGTMAKSRQPKELASALYQELENWSNGQRDPALIATFWRDRLSSEKILSKMLEGL